jgi:Sel1 repeat
MQKVVRIVAFTSILFVSIVAVIGQQTNSIDPSVPHEAAIVFQGNVEGTNNPSYGTPLSRANLRQITKTQEAPKVRSQYRREKAKEDARGINNLGMMLLNGVGEDRDLVEAFNLFTLAAGAGDAEAINNLGQMYEMGWGTPVDTKTAIELYAKALRKGSAAARTNYRRLAHAAAISDRESSALSEATIDRKHQLPANTQNKTAVRTSQIKNQIEVLRSSNPEAAQGSTGAISTRSKLDSSNAREVTSDSTMLESRKAVGVQKSRKALAGITPPTTRRMQVMRPARKDAAKYTSQRTSADCRRFRRDGSSAGPCDVQQIGRTPPSSDDPGLGNSPPGFGFPFFGGFEDD